MQDITDAQFDHILKMRSAGKSLEEIQAYMADCILANDLEVEKERVEKERKESMED